MQRSNRLSTGRPPVPPRWYGVLGGNVLILGLVSFLNDASSEMIYPLLPAFLSGVLGAGPMALGVIEGIAESTSSWLKLFSGYLSDRIDRRKGWVLGGYLLSNTVRPMIALASSTGAVLLLRFFDRMGKGIRTSPRDALLAESTPPPFLGTAFGFHRGADHAGAVLGPLLASALLFLTDLSLRTVFFLSFVPGFISVLVLAIAVREPRRMERAVHDHKPLRLAMAWRGMSGTLRRLMLILFLFTLGNSTDAFLLLKAERLGVPISLLPMLWMVLHLVKVATSLPAGIGSDRWGRKRLILTGWGIYALVYVGFAYADSAWHAWGLFAAYGLYFGLTEGAEKALIADLAPTHLRGSAFGLYHLTVGMATLPASLLFGLLWQIFDSRVAFFFGGSLALMASVALAILPLNRRMAASV